MLRRGLAGLASLSLLLLASASQPASAATPGYGSGPGPVSTSPYGNFNPQLARAPYVTDLTQTSAQLTWATNSNIYGSLTWGPSGNCTQNAIAVTSTTPVQVSPAGAPSPRNDYQSSVQIAGLTASTRYCYEVLDASSPPVDLLPLSLPYQTFQTLDPVTAASTTPLTFDVVADLGETMNRGTPYDPNNNPINANQSAIDSLIGSSGARFVVATGDIAYNDGSNSNYGDLQQTGTSSGAEISNVFGPSYWPLTGGIPTFAAIGNHGQNSNASLLTWPETTTVKNDPGAYYNTSNYAGGIDSLQSASYPTGYYAFSSGNARFYVLDASWNDCSSCNFGTAAGSACPDLPNSSNCKGYQVDADVHFAQNSPQYQWLSADLAAHPGGIKLAFWHYPLRSDNATNDSDVYLQQALEPLLAQNGVNIAFNGHAHDYERNTTAWPKTVISYVTGGGGGQISTVAGAKAPLTCGAWDAYAIGWAYGFGSGSACNAALPTSDSQVYNFLKVTVQGTQVTVTPINATGKMFDQQTYNFAPPVPSTPSNATAVPTSPTSVQLSWSTSTETGCWVVTYQITRNGAALATVPASTTSYTDSALQANTVASYTVTAVDAAGSLSLPGTSNQVTTPLFANGFETGSMSGWTKVAGGVTVVQSPPAHSGTHLASLSATAGQSPNTAYALQNLSMSSLNLYAQAWVQVANQSTTATLLGLRTPTGQVAQVYLSNGAIKVLDNLSHASYLSGTTIPPGSWHQVTLNVNETAGTMEVWVDGLPVQFTVSSGPTYVISGQNFGSSPAPMSSLQVGDDSSTRTYTWYADDVLISTVAGFLAPAPTAPSGVIATAESPTSVRLNWGASSEPGGTVSTYQVSRNGTHIATVQVPTISYTDSGLQPGTSASYVVTAVDTYGSASPAGASNQVTTPLFTAGFESGNMSSWNTVQTVTVQQMQSPPAHSGAYAASLSAAPGSQSFAIENLTSSSPVLYAQGWVYVASQSTTVTPFGLRTSSGQVARVFLQSNGALSIANNVDPAHPSYVGNVTVATGAWHEVTFAVDETAGSMQAWLDGQPVTFNTSSGSITNQNLGTTPMSSLQLGDDSTQHAYSMYADDITVSTVRPAF